MSFLQELSKISVLLDQINISQPEAPKLLAEAHFKLNEAIQKDQLDNPMDELRWARIMESVEKNHQKVLRENNVKIKKVAVSRSLQEKIDYYLNKANNTTDHTSKLRYFSLAERLGWEC